MCRRDVLAGVTAFLVLMGAIWLWSARDAVDATVPALGQTAASPLRTWVEGAQPAQAAQGSAPTFDIASAIAALDVAGSQSEMGVATPVPEKQVRTERQVPVPVGPVLQWKERGHQKQYEVALDEVYVGLGQGDGQGVQKIAPQKNLAAVMVEAARVSAEKGLATQLVLYPVGAARTEWSRRVLSRKVLIQADDIPAVRTAMAAIGVVDLVEPEYAGGYVVARLEGDPARALAVAEALQGVAGVSSAVPMLAGLRQSKSTIPNDPLFSQQWHLLNVGQSGGTKNMDAQIVNVWDTFQGDGITIGIIDDGLALTHQDIAPNAAASGHYDWNGSDTDPAPDVAKRNFHGTSVAGVAAGRGGNAEGISGAAPRAELVGLRLISAPSTDEDEAEAMVHLSDVIQVKNNSWGAADSFAELGPIGPLFEAALATATASGRGGLGTLFFWAAGNGRDLYDQGNKDAAANNIHVIPVGAVTNRGALAGYSETGSHLTVVAPSSGGTADVVTTDLIGTDGYNDGTDSRELADDDYTNDFGGTSSATPLAAGIGALMLQANPNLTWRDVKEILLRSSTKLSPTSSGWVSRTGGQPALPVIKHHHSFGGGMINAQAAVAMAQTWQSLPAAVSHEITNSTPVLIPDGRSNVTEVFDFSSMTAMRVEHVEVKVDIDHDFRGDLDISLVSPAGVISQLAARSPYDGGGLDLEGDFLGEGYIDWTFTSVRHWGESSNGQWKVIIRDLSSRQTGTVYSVRVRLHGIPAPAVDFAVNGQPEGLLVAEGSPAQFVSTTTGYPTISHQWRKNGSNIAGATDASYAFAAAALSQVGRFSDRVSNLTGFAISAEVPLGVVRVINDAPIFNEGATLSLATTAAGGVPLSYQWKMGGIDLVDDGRISGATTPKLSIKATTVADDGDYECIVSDGTRTLSAGTRAVQIRLRPVVQGMAIADAAVSQSWTISIIADNVATSFTSTRLPSGMRLNAKTGVITGRPVLPGDYTFTVYASNAAGKSPGQTFTWHVEALDDDVMGSFQGLVNREPALNLDLGGSITAKVTSTGTYTGSLQLGATRYSFRGMLDTAPGTDPIGISTIARRGLPDLVVDFTISNTTGEIIGTVTDGTATAGLLARRNPWNARSFSAEAYAGYYTFAMDLNSHVGDAAVPQGTGYGTATVTTAGGIRWSGRLADGTSVSGSSTFDLDGRWSGFNLLYSSTGSLLGWRDMDLGAANNFALNTIAGSLTWLRKVQPATQRLYQAGFGLVTLNVHGGKYTKPASGVIVIGLEDPLTFIDGKNALLDFVDGGIESASHYSGLHPLAFGVTTKNTTVVPKAGTVENPASLRIAVNAGTGLISGSLALADANPAVPTTTIKRSVSYLGVLLPQEAQGKGYFVLPTLPEASPAPVVAPTKTPILGGGFVLDAAPH